MVGSGSGIAFLCRRSLLLSGFPAEEFAMVCRNASRALYSSS